MILGYTIPNAEAYITKGRKIHSFRLDPKRRWKPGLKIQHATGVRTKKYNCFQVNDCKHIQEAKFEFKGGRLLMWVEGRKMSERQTAEFVYNDGLESVLQFVQFIFFDKKKKRQLITEASGRIIHWTNKTYY
jgi:hypothetical protein